MPSSSPTEATPLAPTGKPTPVVDTSTPGSRPTGLEVTAPEVPEALVPQKPVRAPEPVANTPSEVAAPAPTESPKPRTGSAPSPTAKAPSGDSDAPAYILGPNDVVSVVVWGDKNLSGTYAIGPDGRMSVPLIGDFKAIGVTIPELQSLITQKLKDYINEPIVNVQLLRNNSKKYTLLGGVLKSGPYPLVQQTTILDALAASGGFKDFANKKKIVLMRGNKKFPFNYTDVTKGKNMSQNITLEDGDIIFVPGE